jgi:hypothetical protein
MNLNKTIKQLVKEEMYSTTAQRYGFPLNSCGEEISDNLPNIVDNIETIIKYIEIISSRNKTNDVVSAELLLFKTLKSNIMNNSKYYKVINHKFN